MSDFRTGYETNKTITYGILEPTINQLRGIRYLVPEAPGEGAGDPVDKPEVTPPAAPETPVTPETPAVTPDTPPAGDEGPSKDGKSQVDPNEDKAPWEEDGKTFDADSAKKLLTGLRADKVRLSEANTYLRSEVTRLTEANDTYLAAENTRQTEEKGRTTQAKKVELAEKYGVTENLRKYIVGDDEKAWEEAAKELGGTRAPKAPTGSNQSTAGFHVSEKTREERIVENANRTNRRQF